MGFKERQHFIIAGCQRCGTSFLAKQLEQHPQISLAKPSFPEPKFFLKEDEYKLGLEYYHNRYFSDAGKRDVLVEKSTSYIESPIAAERIKKTLPNAKIIISLRNPVERALSNYFYSKKNQVETRSLSEVFLEKFPAPKLDKEYSVSPFSYLERGKYISYLPLYLDLFGKENIKIVLLENLIGNEQEYLGIQLFLGVQPQKMPSGPNSKNEAERTERNPEVKDYLYQYFTPFNKQLESLLKTDLSIWDKRD